MTGHRWFTRCGLLAVVLLATAGVAFAGPIVELTVDGLGAGSFVNVQRNGVGLTTPAGQYYVHLSSNPSVTINTFCIDFDHNGHNYLVEIRSTNDGLPMGPQLAYLYNKYGSQTLSDNTLAAAIQVAMWDLIDDHGDGVTQGFFQDNQGDAIATLADSLIQEALGSPGSETTWFDATLNGTDPNRGQNMIGGDPQPPPTRDIPEPGTLLILGLGVVGLSVVGWRTRGRWAKS
jgi:PEP-CTERM motif-containing protein